MAKSNGQSEEKGKWPWDGQTRQVLTGSVIEEIIENLPKYAHRAGNCWVTERRDSRRILQAYCAVEREYFGALAEKGDINPDVLEEALELLRDFPQWVDGQHHLVLDESTCAYYNDSGVSYDELRDGWDVIRLRVCSQSHGADVVANASRGKAEQKKKRRVGRPCVTKEEAERRRGLKTDWERYRDTTEGRSKKETFCEDKEIKIEDLEALLHWCRTHSK